MQLDISSLKASLPGLPPLDRDELLRIVDDLLMLTPM